MSNKFSLILGTTLLSITAGTMAYAQSNKQDSDAFADLAKAQVPITQAIAAAEQVVGGKATSVELENEKQGLIYKVEVANAATRKVMDVQVDGTSGKVLSTQEDRADREGKDEADDD